MIIQCTKCRTKFNLALSGKPEKFRVRCSVCGNIFSIDLKESAHPPDLAFQKRNLDLFLEEILKLRPDVFGHPPPSAARVSDRRGLAANQPAQDLIEKSKSEDRPATGKKPSSRRDVPEAGDITEAVLSELDFPSAPVDGKETMESLPEDRKPASARPGHPLKMADISLMDLDEPAGQTSIPDLSKDMLHIQAKEMRKPKQLRTGTRPGFWVSLLRVGFFLLALVFICAALLWLYPQSGQSLLKWASTNIPFLNQIAEIRQGTRPTGPIENLLISDVRQRFIQNPQVGRLRVVEGVLSNTADYPLSGVRLMAKLYDAHTIPLEEKVVYCGNTLENSALASLDAEHIQTALSRTEEGRDRLAAKAQISFMVVFANEPEGVTQVLITPLTAERVDLHLPSQSSK